MALVIDRTVEHTPEYLKRLQTLIYSGIPEVSQCGATLRNNPESVESEQLLQQCECVLGNAMLAKMSQGQQWVEKTRSPIKQLIGRCAEIPSEAQPQPQTQQDQLQPQASSTTILGMPPMILMAAGAAVLLLIFLRKRG